MTESPKKDSLEKHKVELGVSVLVLRKLSATRCCHLATLRYMLLVIDFVVGISGELSEPIPKRLLVTLCIVLKQIEDNSIV